MSGTTSTTESLASSASESVDKKPIKRNLIESKNLNNVICHLLLFNAVILENVLLRKKRKHTNVDESLNNVVDKLVKREDAADKRFLELEERRMKREEEIEERRQIREQEHEKHMQGMFMQFMQQMIQNNSYPRYSSVEYDHVNSFGHANL